MNMDIYLYVNFQMFYTAKEFMLSKYKRNRYCQMEATEDKGEKDTPLPYPSS